MENVKEYKLPSCAEVGLLDDIINYIEKKHFNYKLVESTKGREINLQICPFCKDNKNHFFLNSISGQYYCHKCNAAGGIYALKKHMGDLAEPLSFEDLAPKEDKIIYDEIARMTEVDSAHLRLLQNKNVLLYLSSRAFSLEAVKHFKLGFADEFGKQWIWYPYITDGKLKNIKKRTLPPAEKGFMRLDGGESSLYNEEVLKQIVDYIIVCEGEADTISLWSKGFRNVVATSIGAKGIKNEWITILDKVPSIYICYDTDNEGQLGAQKIAARLGIERCQQIKLPPKYKDINEYFQRGNRVEDFQKLIDNAERFDVESVKSIGGFIKESIRRIYAGQDENKLELPWKNVNRLIGGGFAPGDLIVLASKPKVGKTSAAFNILYHFAKNDIPSLLFSLEMTPWRILPRLVALHRHKDSRSCSELNELSEAYKELRHMPLYMAYKYNKPTWEFISDTIRHCVRRYGIQFVVFDNLHFLCRSLIHQTQEVSTMSQNFKLLAEELVIPILLIARPRKTSANVISGDDLKDSADVLGDLDILITLTRDRKKSMNGEEIEGAFEPKTLVDIPAVRYAAGGSTYLWANDAECRFDSID